MRFFFLLFLVFYFCFYCVRLLASLFQDFIWLCVETSEFGIIAHMDKWSMFSYWIARFDFLSASRWYNHTECRRYSVTIERVSEYTPPENTGEIFTRNEFIETLWNSLAWIVHKITYSLTHTSTHTHSHYHTRATRHITRPSSHN